MITPRGWAVLGGGVALYLASRAIGSPNLHIAAFGVLSLPLFAMGLLKLARSPVSIRRKPAAERTFPGSRVRIDVQVKNEGRRTTPLILFEDHVPPSFGRSARAVLPGIPAEQEQVVSYLVSCRKRGRYQLGPARLQLTDPFGLARVIAELPETDDLVVYPEIEDLSAQPVAAYGAGSGESPFNRIFRGGQEFYGMREYMTGDDLRRIHWPSTARTGQLMIRQEEVARRSVVTFLVDNRSAAVGKDGSPSFEKAISAAASVGVLLARRGFALRMGTADLPPVPRTEEAFLEHLAAISASRTRSLGSALLHLKGKAVSDSTLVVVSAPPEGPEVAALIRAASGFGPKMAVFVYPTDPKALAVREQVALEGRASAAHASLARVGWDVFVIAPEQRLAEAWHNRTTLRHAAGSRS